MGQIALALTYLLGEMCGDLCLLTKLGLPFDRGKTMGSFYPRETEHEPWLGPLAPRLWPASAYVLLLREQY